MDLDVVSFTGCDGIGAKNVSHGDLSTGVPQLPSESIKGEQELEMPGIEPGAFHMQSERATTALHPLAPTAPP